MLWQKDVDRCAFQRERAEQHCAYRSAAGRSIPQCYRS